MYVSSKWFQWIYFNVVTNKCSLFFLTGVRGTKGFTSGIHVWDVHFLEPPNGTSVMVGVGTERALLHKGNYSYVDLIGKTNRTDLLQLLNFSFLFLNVSLTQPNVMKLIHKAYFHKI